MYSSTVVLLFVDITDERYFDFYIHVRYEFNVEKIF
jgi:hypothetical protein